MARIDLARRAQIGITRRERTRRALLDTAKRVFSETPIEQLNVDDIVEAAGVAKGTFYYHFRDFDALLSALGEELAREFDELLQPQLTTLQAPLERFALGQLAFLRKAEAEPRWGRLVRHSGLAEAGAAASVRNHLTADLAGARDAGDLTGLEVPFAVRLVIAMAMEFLGEDGGPAPKQRPSAVHMVETILRALGVERQEAAAIVARVGAVNAAEVPPDGRIPRQRVRRSAASREA